MRGGTGVIREAIPNLAVSGGGGGSGAPTDAHYITTQSEGGLSAEAVLGTDIIIRDVAANIPAASIAGRVFVESDGSRIIYRDTGLAWVEIARGVIVAANISDFNTAVATTAVLKSLYDANTILAATTDDTPAALTMGASTILARLAAGNIVAATPAQIRTLIGSSYVVDEVHADAGSASSVAEQTLATLVLPAGVAVAGDILRFTAIGDGMNNTGGTVTYTFRFKIGGTTIFTTTALPKTSNANRHKWWVDLQIAVAATNAQRIGGILSGVVAGSTTTWQAITAAHSAVGYGTAAEDYTAAANHILTCQLDTNNAAADVILHAASLTLIKK